MSATITKINRIEAAKDYITKNFIDNTSHFYTGRNIPYTDEYSPDISVSSDLQITDALRQRIFLKIIEENDTNLAIKRFDWEGGKIYHAADYSDNYDDYRNWDHPESPFYIYSLGNIYKCIYNNNNNPSTMRPLGESLGYITPGDGYIWKFMLNLSSTISDKFLTDTWVPIPFRTAEKSLDHTSVEGAAVIGDIVAITITAGGDKYTSTPTIVIKGNGTGCVANAIMNGEALESIIVSSAGSGYDYAEVCIYGDGNNAEAIAQISPSGGHGSDAAMELGAYYVIVSKNIIGSEDGVAPVLGTYRNIGIVRNTKDTNGFIITKLITEKFNTFSNIVINNCSGTYTVAEKIIGEDSLAEGYVYIDPGGPAKTVVIYIVEGTFIDGERIYGQESGIVGEYVLLGSNYTNVDILSGDILYKENIQFIARRLIQTEKFVFTIEF